MFKMQTLVHTPAVFLVLLGTQNLHHSSHFFVSAGRGQNSGGPGNPANQNLSTSDSSPGSLVLPRNYKSYRAPLPKIDPRDLTDDQINVNFYNYRNNSKYRLWKKPPCEWYQEHLDSSKNQDRQDGCYHILNRLKKNFKKERKNNQPPSVKCAGAHDARCFQFMGRRGRCYIKVKTGPSQYDQKYVLANDCD